MNLNNKLVVGISSRALFNLDESNLVYEQDGIDAYSQYQIDHENDILEPGIAFGLVKKFLKLNEFGPYVEIILLSRNSADTGLRVFNSIEEYDLSITRAAFSSGESPYRYVKAFGAHLFLSTNPEDTRKALLAGCAAATILGGESKHNKTDNLHIAFDGDCVLFSDEAEKIFQAEGFDAFAKNEKDSAHTPLRSGSFKGFLLALHAIQSSIPPEQCPIRTALVTARSAPAHERVVRTLRAWGIRIDEALFLGGLSKGDFLNAFSADIFFDDQQSHCDSAKEHVATAHVPHGVMNE